jgi:hypothetical protein
MNNKVFIITCYLEYLVTLVVCVVQEGANALTTPKIRPSTNEGFN